MVPPKMSHQPDLWSPLVIQLKAMCSEMMCVREGAQLCWVLLYVSVLVCLAVCCSPILLQNCFRSWCTARLPRVSPERCPTGCSKLLFVGFLCSQSGAYPAYRSGGLELSTCSSVGRDISATSCVTASGTYPHLVGAGVLLGRGGISCGYFTLFMFFQSSRFVQHCAAMG